MCGGMPARDRADAAAARDAWADGGSTVGVLRTGAVVPAGSLFGVVFEFDIMMPLGPISLSQDTTHTSHIAPCATKAPGTDKTARHPPRAQQEPARSEHTTEIEAQGQAPSAQNHAQTPQRCRAGTKEAKFRTES